MKFDVFISYRNLNPDVQIARNIYRLLKELGVRTFFSEESLAEVGKGHFGKTIELALESATVLVLVASTLENLESPFVQAEWDCYLNDIRSGHKDGELFLVNGGSIKAGQLPLWLRRHQMFEIAETDHLVQFIKKAVPRALGLKDVIKYAFHSKNPQKNEDKIYLVTVHNPNGNGFNVTAHWGPRSAKRLNSQVKATNLEDENEAATIVTELSKRKIASGYQKASFSKILTKEARATLESSLGIALPLKPKKSKSVAGR